MKNAPSLHSPRWASRVTVLGDLDKLQMNQVFEEPRMNTNTHELGRQILKEFVSIRGSPSSGLHNGAPFPGSVDRFVSYPAPTRSRENHPIL